MLAYVYILSSKRNGTLYVGATRDLIRRIYAHINYLIPGLTAEYKVTRLVYFAQYDMYNDAFTIERRIKKWKRVWKIRLIEEMNPEWIDLYDCLLGNRPLSTQGKRVK